VAIGRHHEERDMAHKTHDTGIGSQIFGFKDGVEAAPGLRWLVTSGTPGLTRDGQLAPDIEGQTVQAWTNILEVLASAGMGIEDIVKTTTYIRNAEDIPAYGAARNKVFTGEKPATMLLVAQMVKPEYLVEVEVMAAKA
jgi:enamine deaminase RidA (YjgF/YER057c/UK114 family)